MIYAEPKGNDGEKAAAAVAAQPGQSFAPSAPSLFARMRALFRSRAGELLAAASVMGTPVANLVAGAVMVKCLLPEETGVLTIANLWPAYLTFLHLGSLNGMARELPISLGAGEKKRAEEILNATSAVAWWVALIGGLIPLISALYVGWHSHDKFLAAGLVAAAFTMLATPIALQVDTGLRSLHHFRQFGTNQVVDNVARLLSVLLIPWFGFFGAIWRNVVTCVVTFLIRMRQPCLRRTWRIDKTEFRRLATVGFPLLISGTLFNYLMVSDRSVVALMLGRHELGCFTLAGIVVTSMQFVPQSISMIMFPKMAHCYGQTRDPAALRPYVVKTLIFNILALAPLSLLAYCLIPIVISRFFPAYSPGIPAARLACITCVFWVYLGTGSVFGVLNKMFAYLCVLCSSVLLVWLLSAFLIKQGYGIEGAAVARLVATMVICCFTVIYSFILTSKKYARKNADA